LIYSLKRRVEGADAVEARCKGDFGHRKIACIDKALGALNARGAGRGVRRGVQMLPKQSRQVPRTQTKPRSERFDIR